MCKALKDEQYILDLEMKILTKFSLQAWSLVSIAVDYYTTMTQNWHWINKIHIL